MPVPTNTVKDIKSYEKNLCCLHIIDILAEDTHNGYQ